MYWKSTAADGQLGGDRKEIESLHNGVMGDVGETIARFFESYLRESVYRLSSAT